MQHVLTNTSGQPEQIPENTDFNPGIIETHFAYDIFVPRMLDLVIQNFDIS